MNHNLKIQNKTIVFTGGGTGGHLWPLVSIVTWCRKNLGIHPVYFGTGTALEKRAWRRLRIRQIYIPSGKLRNYKSLRNFFDLLMIPVGVIKAYYWLRVYKPALVFGKGGYGMLPTAIAARWLGIPVISHESDIVLGRANRKALDWKSIILTAFPTDLYDVPGAHKDRLRYVGMPVHPDFYKRDKSSRNKYGNSVLVFGGSQGAERINKVIAAMWDKLAQFCSVTHVCGPANYKRYKYILSKQPEAIKCKITLLPEVDNLPEYIKKAKIVVCRAGATSLWEIVTSETPAVVIPLPESANDHQRLNALWLSQEFPWVKVVEEKKILPSQLLSQIRNAVVKDNEYSSDSASLVMPDEALVEIGKVINEGLIDCFLKTRRHFHLIGSMGVSMQGIKKVLLQMGHLVTGSDITDGGHSEKNITSNIDAVVYSSAAQERNAPGFVEIEVAENKKIPAIKRSRFISDLVNIKKLISVSGMHGKSTTASMIAYLLKESGRKPTYFIGVPETVAPRGVGAANWEKNGNIAVVEACEYDRSFCEFSSDVLIVTNVEEEHLDYFKGGIREIEKAFDDFITRARPCATVLVGDQNESTNNIVKKVADDRPDIIIKFINKQKINSDELLVFGEHNILNATLAVEAVSLCGVDKADAWQLMKKFEGAKRRQEFIGDRNGALIYDDYGHHPTEIEATIKSFKQKFPNKKIIIIFQPHQISRTRYFFRDFVKVLSIADNIYITDIYEVAGREGEADISSEKLVDAINKNKKGLATYVPLPYEKITSILKANIKPGDLVVTIGATDIYKVAEELLNEE